MLGASNVCSFLVIRSKEVMVSAEIGHCIGEGDLSGGWRWFRVYGWQERGMQRDCWARKLIQVAPIREFTVEEPNLGNNTIWREEGPRISRQHGDIGALHVVACVLRKTYSR